MTLEFCRGLTPQPKKDPSPSSPPTPQRERKQAGGRGQISDGSLVRLKNGPPCGPNSIVFTRSSTHGPQVGRSVSVMERSSIDPKTSVLVKVFRDRTGSSSSAQSNFELASQNLHGSANIYSGLEVWKLSDVVFLDDSPSILGRVIAVDGAQVVVDCSYSEASTDLGEGTSSAAKSSLKVFRLSDLEGCIEGPDFQSKGSNIPPGEPSTSSTNPQPPPRAITHHVAGVVQHRPVCLVDPLSTSSSGRNIGSSIPEPMPQSQTGQLRGFRTLAAHATDSGPNLLVERVSDQSAFLVCSAHLTMSGINGTSFVAVGNHDTKKKRSTVVEEAVNSVESGLASDGSLLQAVQNLSNRFQTGSEADVGESVVPKKAAVTTTVKSSCKESHSGKTRGPSRKGKGVSSMAGKGSSRVKRSSSTKHVHFQRDKVAVDTGPGSATVGPDSVPKSRVTSCEFVPLSANHPDLFFVRDAGGTIWPLLDGLGLAPTPPECGTTGRPKRPVRSYRCISVRQYAVQGEDRVAVFVLGT